MIPRPEIQWHPGRPSSSCPTFEMLLSDQSGKPKRVKKVLAPKMLLLSAVAVHCCLPMNNLPH